MTAASVARIRRSYDHMAPHLGRVASAFYERLFATWPAARGLFAANMDAQGKHFAAALALIVRNLGVFDTLEQPLRELGAAHARVGVRAEHYPVVCDAIVSAVAHALGDHWSAELNADWRALLALVSRHMLAGAAASASGESRRGT